MDRDEKSPAEYEIYAIRYATNSKRTRGQNFIKDADPTALLTMDFFSWVLIRDGKAIVVDTGMAQDKATRNGHEWLASPIDILRKLGVDPASVETVIMTHLHYDHTGNTDAFPNANFLLQAEEMNYISGPYMEKAWFRHAYAVDELQKFLGYLHGGRLKLHGRDHVVTDGVSVHWVGGHTAGQEIVRVRTKRGWVVLASDALHYEEELTAGIPFTVTFSIPDMILAHDRISELADSEEHIVVAHDPKVMELYAAPTPELKGLAVRLHAPPQAR